MSEKTVAFVVHVWLDVENTILGVSRQPFMKDVRSLKWSRRRMELFTTYTLRSLMRQRFDNFRILLFLNPRYRSMHRQFDLPEKVLKIYDAGKSFYTKHLKTDYVVIFRTDSDDLLHRDVMAIVRDTAVYKNFRTSCTFHKVIQWNLHHKFISDYTLPRSPFTAHVFPRKIYSNWDRIKVEQFMDYRTNNHHFEERKICIIRHGSNVTFPRTNKNMYSRRYYSDEMYKRNNVIKDPSKMQKILRYYGIPPELVK